MTIIDRK